MHVRVHEPTSICINIICTNIPKNSVKAGILKITVYDHPAKHIVFKNDAHCTATSQDGQKHYTIQNIKNEYIYGKRHQHK